MAKKNKVYEVTEEKTTFVIHGFISRISTQGDKKNRRHSIDVSAIGSSYEINGFFKQSNRLPPENHVFRDIPTKKRMPLKHLDNSGSEHMVILEVSIPDYGNGLVKYEILDMTKDTKLRNHPIKRTVDKRFHYQEAPPFGKAN